MSEDTCTKTAQVAVCHACQRQTDECMWPDSDGHEVCQMCWEKLCETAWWDRIKQIGEAMVDDE